MKQGEVFKWGLTLAGLFAVYKLMQKFGIVKSAQQEQEATERAEAITANIWLPTLEVDPAFKKYNIMTLTRAGRNLYAEDIYKAHGVFNDDEEAIYSTFRSLRYQSQVSSIAEAFRRLYNQDLVTWLRDILNDEEFTTVLNIIKSKPLGITKK